MTVPEFVEKMAALANMPKTAAVNLVVKITGQTVRTVWRQAEGDSGTPPAVDRLLDVYMSRDVPCKAKLKLFPEVFSYTHQQIAP